MSPNAFKNGIADAAMKLGFRKQPGSLIRISEEVATLIAIDKVFGAQFAINVGIWIRELGVTIPNKVEQCHLYFRLERLLPEHRDTILQASDLQDSHQHSAYDALERLFDGPFAAVLNELGTTDGIGRAFRSGRLTHGLIVKDARTLIERRAGEA